MNPTMNVPISTRIMINRLDTGELLCNRSYADLQDESHGCFDRNPARHDSVPWQIDAVCCCCREAHPHQNDAIRSPTPGLRVMPARNAGIRR